MNLHDYLKQPDSLTVAQLRERLGSISEAQIRQWQHGYAGRKPGPENCVQIERVTAGAVRRWDLRPDDWHLIWPELVGAKGAPAPQARLQERGDAGCPAVHSGQCHPAELLNTTQQSCGGL